MPVRWESTKVDGKEMRVYTGIPEKPGPHPGIVIADINATIAHLRSLRARHGPRCWRSLPST